MEPTHRLGDHSEPEIPAGWMLLSRYLLRNLSTDQRAETERWIAEHPERAAQVQRIRQAMVSAPPIDRGSTESVEQALASVMQRFRIGQSQNHHPVSSHKIHGRMRTKSNASWKPVALMGGVIALAVAAFVVLRTPSVEALGERTRVYTTARAQRSILGLGDGLQVVLGPETQLRFATARDGGRRISLVGEAYFTVSPDSRAPFIVQAGNTETRVLGTEFSVRRYAGDSLTEVAVVSGRVATSVTGSERSSDATRSWAITPGMFAYVGDSTVTIRIVDTKAITQWTRGRLVFEDAKVSDVLRVLSRWSGYEFRLADSALAGQSVNASFAVDRPAEVLTNLRDLLDVELVPNGDVIMLRPSRKPRAGPARMQGTGTHSMEVGK